MKNIIIWIKIIFITIYCSIKFILTKDEKWVKKWSNDILSVSKVKVECNGEFPNLPFIIMANHESYFDIFSLSYCTKIHILWFAKKELFRIPLLGSALRISRAIPIDRQDARKSSFALMRALKQETGNAVISIFPQGTRKNKTAFKKGGLLIAKKKHIPIVPVKIRGSANILSSDSLKINSGIIKIDIFDAIDVDKYSVDELEKIIREKIYED